MVERLMAPVLKTGRAQALVGSNPTPSASLRFGAQRKAKAATPGVKQSQAYILISSTDAPGTRLTSKYGHPSTFTLLSVRQTRRFTILALPVISKKRLLEHNQGKCPHTAQSKPWRIETAIAFRSEGKAGAFERYLKSGSGREFARRDFLFRFIPDV